MSRITGLGLEPVWSFPRAHPLEVLDLGIGVLAGIGGAVVAAAFTYAARGFRAGFRRMPAFARPVIGGLALGGLAFASPYALTYGENQITHVLDTRLLIGTLVVAGLVKLAASSMIVSAGWRGGFIIPLFFIGVVFGSAISQAARHRPDRDHGRADGRVQRRRDEDRRRIDAGRRRDGRDAAAPTCTRRRRRRVVPDESRLDD